MKEPRDIQRIRPINNIDFYNRYVRKQIPVIISGLVNDWKAFELWDLAYFLEHFGKTVVQAYQLNGKGECELDVNRGSATKEVILTTCLNSINHLQLKGKWAVASSIDLFPPQLKMDFRAPLYCVNGKFLRSMIFIGPQGVVSPLHQDLPENLYVMVAGKKRVTLFAPSDKVYPNSRLSNLPNHSQIDAENPDYSRFPETRMAQPYIVDLSPGETLFIPSFWWHHLRNLEPSISMNFWWSQGWKLPIAWVAAMYKKHRKI